MVATNFSGIVPKLASGTVTVIGDAMIDHFVYGTATRISPEAPIPVLTIARETVVPGGAANVVQNLTSLGGAARFYTVIGDDRYGGDLAELITGNTLVEPSLVVEPGRITTQKTRYIASGQQLIRADRETAVAITPATADHLLHLTTGHLSHGDVMILSDYGKGVLVGGLAHRLIKAAHAAGALVIVDPKGHDFSRYSGADIITPNRKELGEATGMAVDSETRIVEAADHLRTRHQFGAVLVTRSEDGMSLISRDGVYHFPAEAAEVFDVSGAGDTVVATLALALSVKVDLLEAVRLANVAAGVAVAKVGTATVRPSELLVAFNPTASAARKIVSLETATDAAERWRLRGYRVGFTNGCFDLLHPGHVHLLEQARANCDRLIVGMNTDESIRRIKSPSRPIQDEHARATVLSSLTTVDLVCPFQEDTPLPLIEAIRPDLIIKGADYTTDAVVGGTLVTSWGGKVFLADLLPGHSTTKTIARLLA